VSGGDTYTVNTKSISEWSSSRTKSSPDVYSVPGSTGTSVDMTTSMSRYDKNAILTFLVELLSS